MNHRNTNKWMTVLDSDHPFPFRNTEDVEFIDTNSNDVGEGLHSLHKYEKINLKTFDYTEHNEIENGIDPENHFYNINNDCECYTEDKFNYNMKLEGVLSLIHFNSRSLYTNLVKIKDYLRQFVKRFNVIAISETWLCDD